MESITLLLVDDHPGNLLTFEAALHSLGVNIVKVSTGKEALQACLENDFAVILLHETRPDTDVFTLAAFIRQNERTQSTPVIFITEREPHDPKVIAAYLQGDVDFLNKPVVPDVLRAKIKTFIHHFTTTKALQTANTTLTQQIEENQRLQQEVRDQEHIRFLTEASTLLASSLDYEATLKTIARLCVPGIADACVINILDDKDVLQNLITTHFDPDQERVAQDLLRRLVPDPDQPDLSKEVVRTGQSILIPEVPDELAHTISRDEETLHLLQAFHLKSLMFIPLKTRGRIVGVLSLYMTEERRFAARDLAFAEELATRSATAVDNARLYQESQQRQEQLRVTLTSIGDAVIVTDTQGYVTLMNSVAERLTGWIQADALGKPLDEMFNIIHEETRQSVENPVVKVLGEGVVVELANHTALLTKDGREIPIEDSGAPIRDADGAILGVVLVFRDATQKHQIQETRARLAAIVEGSDDAIISKNLDGVITSWNQGAERMYGYTATEAVGQPITMLIPPHRPDEEAAILERLKRGERVDHFETQRMHRDGTLLDVSLTVSPIYNALGQVNGASKIARDVTERKRAERELREITEFYRQLQEQLTRLVEASSHLLSSLNLNHILPTILDMAHQLVAADMYAIWRFFSDTKEWRIIGEVGLSEEFKRMTLPGSGNEPLHSPMLAEDINAFPMLASRREIYTKEGIRSLLVLPLRIYGQTSGTMVFYWREKKQFTELQVRVATAFANIVGAAVGSAELYEEQQQLRLQAQQAVQDRDEFLSVAAHELKTPITSMRGFTQLHLRRLEKSGAVDLEALKRSLLVVDKQAGKLTQLVDQLLDLARIEAGKLTLEPELIDVVKLVQDTVDSIQPNTEQHLITVHAPAQLGAVVDPIRFEQVVTNLLNNALKYSPKGGPVEIVLSGPTPDAFTLSITDQGIGIPPEQRERIFDRFYQAHAGLHFGGIGLGLYISRQIIELHGGMIHVEHPEAGGTRFVIELPK